MFTSDIAIFLLGLIAAIFGGYFGAAIGGNFAFTLTGFMILFSWGIFAVGGSDIGFNYVAFGPVMGPHITFAAGGMPAGEIQNDSEYTTRFTY